jgi:hypothetical protein
MRTARQISESESTIIDELMDIYLQWREAAVEVGGAYERWSVALGSDRALAFAAYLASLEREEQAADCYRGCADRATALWSDLGLLVAESI